MQFVELKWLLSTFELDSNSRLGNLTLIFNNLRRFLLSKFSSIYFKALIASVLLVTFHHSVAQTWLPTTGGSWTTAANWSTNSVPVAGADVVINTDQTGDIINVPTITLGSLDISGTCRLASTAPITVAAVTISNAFSVSVGETLTTGIDGSGFRLTITLSTTCVGNIAGSVIITSGGVARTFTNNGDLTVTSTGVIANTVNPSNFVLNAGATLRIGSTDGITDPPSTSGNIQTTGLRTFDNGANYVYNNTSLSQSVGTGLPATVASLTIDNTGSVGSNIVSLIANTAITNALIVSNGVLSLATNNITTVGSVNMTGTSITGTGTITLAGNITTSASGSVATISCPIALGGATRNFTVADGIADPDLSISSVVSGGVGFIKAGAGLFQPSGANTYTGATTISAGTLRLGAAGGGTNTPLGTTAGNTSVTSGAVLDLNGFTLGTAEALTLNGTGISSGGALTNSSGTNVSYSGLLTLGSSSSIVTNSGTITLTNTGTITGAGFGLTLGGSSGGTVASVIGTGAGTITKIGSGTWTLSGSSTYAGATTINAGTLRLGAAGGGTNTPLGTTAGNTSVTSGAVLDLNGFTLGTAEALTLNGTGVSSGGALTNSSGTNVSYTGLVTLGSSSSIVANSGTISLTNGGTITGAGFNVTLDGSSGGTIASIIGTGGGAIIKVGAGTWTLSGSNTFTGGVTINAGTLRLGNAGALNSGTPNAVTFSASSTGILQLNNNSVTISALNSNATVGSPIVENATAGNATLTLATSGANTFAGVIRNGVAGTLALTKSGTGSLTLSGNNTYSGTTTLSAGTLNINSTTAIGTGAFTISGGTIDNSSGGAITLVNNNAQNWNGHFVFTGTQDLNLGTGAVVLGANPQVTTNAGALTVGGIISGVGFSLTKLGIGTLRLSGTNTFSGGTTLNAGTLILGNTSALGVAGATVTLNGGVLDLATDATVNAYNTTVGGTATINSNRAISGAGITHILGTLSIGANTLTINQGSNATGTTAAVQFGNLTMTGAATLSPSTANLIMAGTASGAFKLTKSGAGLLQKSTVGWNLSEDFEIAAGTYNANGQTTTVIGLATVSGGEYQASTATQTFNGGLTIAGGTFTGSTGAVDVTTMTLGSGTLTAPTGSFTVSGNWTNNGGTFTAGAGTVTFDGATQTIGGTASTIFNNLTTTGSTNTSTGVATTIGGNLFIGNSTSFTAAGFDLAVTGTTTVGGGTSGSLVISSATGTKTFTGLVTIASGGTWNNSGNEDVTFRGGITNNGTFTAGTGIHTFDTNAQALTATFAIPSVTVTGITLTNNGVLNIGTLLTGSGGLAQGAGSILTLGGGVTITTLTASAAGNTVNYSGASQTIMPTTYFALNNNQSSGFASLGGDVIVTSGLTLTSGNLNLDGNILTYNGTGVIAGGPFSSTKMIIATGGGELRKGFTSNGVFTFPIGENTGATQYSPIDVSVTGSAYASAYVGASVTDAKHPSNASTTNFLTRYWEVTQSGITGCTVATVGTYINSALDVTGSAAAINSAQLTGIFNQSSNPWVKYSPLAGTIVTTGASLSSGQTLACTGITGADPTATITGGGVTICSGSSVALGSTVTGDSPILYSWSPVAGLSATTISNPTASPTVTTPYVLTIRDGNGISVASAPSTITVNPLPTLTSALQSISVCAGSGATIDLTGLVSSTTATINYSINGIAQTPIAGVVSDGTGAGSFTTTSLTSVNNGQNLQISSITITSSLPNCSQTFINNLTLSVDSPASITTQPVVSQTLCAGSALNLGVAATGTGLAYQWKKNTVDIGGATSNTFTIASVGTGDAGSYTVEVTSSGVCTPATVLSTASVVTINSPAAITAQPTATQTLCTGSAFILGVAATGTGLAYQWKKNGVDISGETSNTLNIGSIATTDAGNYTVAVTSSGVCVPATVASGTGVLTVNTPATITAQPVASQTLCAGSALNLSVTATGTGLAYQWKKNTVDIGGATSSTFTIASVGTGDAGSYTVEVTSSGVCTPATVLSTASVVTINSPAVITAQPTAAQTLCTGSAFSLGVTATGTGLAYQWKKNGVDMAGETSNTLNIASVVTGDAGNYTVVVSSSGVCVPATVTSGTGVLTINSPAVITAQPVASQTLCVGSALNLGVTATGTGLSYQWKKDGTDIGGATSNTFTIGSVGTGDAGSYTVEVASSGVCTPATVLSTASVVTINSPAVITAQPTAAQTLCTGSAFSLGVAATGTGLAYQWKKNGVDMAGETSNTLNIASVVTGDAGNYTVTVTSSGVCVPATVASGTGVLTVNSPAVITAQPVASQTLCAGSALNLGVTATGMGLSYQWKKDGTDIGGATSNTFTIGSVGTGDAGSYTVEVASSGVCTPATVLSTASVVTINSPAVITAQPTAAQTLCTGSAFSLGVAATGTGLAYQWKKNGVDMAGETSNTLNIGSIATTDAGNYTVTVTSSGVCVPATVTSGTGVLTVNTPATITAQPVASQTLCAGSALNLGVAATGTGLAYQWKKNTVDIGGATSNTFTIASVGTGDAGSYTVEVTSSGACTPATVLSTASVITINSTAAITAQPTATQTLCTGSAFSLGVAATGTGLAYQWKKNGVDISGETANTLNIGSIATTDAGNYTVTVTSSGVCVPATVASGTGVLTVNTPATITTQPVAAQTLCAGSALNLSVTATGTGLAYQWKKNTVDLGGETSGTFTIASVGTGDAGSYTVEVTSSGVCLPATVTSSIANVGVNSVPVGTTVLPGTYSTCSGGVLNITPVSNVAGTTFSWTGSNGSGGTGNITDTPLNATTNQINVTYTIIPTGPGITFCEGLPFPITVTVNPTPSFSINNLLPTFCEGPLSPTNIVLSSNTVGQRVRIANVIATGGVTGFSPVNTQYNTFSSTIADALVNPTNLSQTVTYQLEGSLAGTCVNAILQSVTVTVYPQPIGVNASATVCSDLPINYNLINNVATLGNNVAGTFTWSALPNPNVVGENTITQLGGIITDSVTNLTNSPQVVVYNVNPMSVMGCAGGVFQISVTVNPEPLGVASSTIICSDLNVGYDLQANVNSGNSLLANFSWVAASNPNVSGESILTRNGPFIDDILINNTNTPQLIVYTIGSAAQSTSCISDLFTVSVTINPRAKISAGPNLTLCENIPTIALQGAVNYAPNGIQWSGGSNNFSNNALATSNYSFANPSEINTSILMTMTAIDPDGAGPCPQEMDQMILTINPLPIVVFTGFPPGAPPQVAENAAGLILTGNQIGGLFTISPGSSNIGSTYVSPVDKTLFTPGAVTLGSNYITYTYTNSNGCTNQETQEVIVNPITTVDFAVQGGTLNALGEFEFCAEQGLVRILGFPAASTGLLPETQFVGIPAFLGGPTIPIVKIGPDYFIQTNGLASNTYRIQYDYKNSFGAITFKIRNIRILASPVSLFTSSNNCIVSDVVFTNQSTVPSSFGAAISNHFWSFGDGEVSADVNPSKRYLIAGIWNVSLRVTTNQGCSTTSAPYPLRVGDVPVVDFDWAAICTNDLTRYRDLTNPGTVSTISFYNWDFGDGDVLTNVPSTGTIPTGTHAGRTINTNRSPWHNYSVNGVYNVTLTVITDDGCSNAKTQSVFILPAGTTVQPTGPVPYYIDFESSDGGWIGEGLRYPASNPPVTSPFSWIYGAPSGSTINAASSGTRAWWTGKNIIAPNNQPTYFSNETSSVNGPCFDLTQLQRPMISLDYWSDTETNYDGAVVQYSTDGGLSWGLVGPLAGLPAAQRDQGINWYDPNTNILSNPGQQLIGPYGWSGKSGNWKNAKFNLDMVNIPERDQVRLRVAFSSNSNVPGDTFNGFAIDNVFIGDKKRLVLIEHFTNASFPGSVNNDVYLNNLYANEISLRPPGYTDFNHVQYHMSYLNNSTDPLTNDDSNVRAQSFGVSTPPQTFMDGINKINSKFDGTTTKLNSIEIDRRALVSPKFRLRLDTIPTGRNNLINVQMSLTADTIVNSPLIVQVALVEDNVITPSGTFRNVLRKLLYGSDPTKPDGITLTQPFTIGQTAVYPQSPNEVELNVPISNPNNLKLLGFVQDKNTGEIYQSVITRSPYKVPSTIVGLEPNPVIADLKDLEIYPNPAGRKFSFSIPGKFPPECIWKIADQRGIFVRSGNFEKAANGILPVDITGLANGVYFVLIGAEGKTPLYKKLVVLNQD
jgi:autotransporter-associated beta strand protein